MKKRRPRAKQYLLEFAHTAKLKKLLPDLAKTIVCGNSLIGRDIINGHLFAAEEERKLNPMNFEDVFPETMKRGGFDAVVGNPPYVLLQILQQPSIFEYIAAKYRAARYKIDTYHVFLERALRLTREGGRVGYITPNTFLRNKHARELRRLILEASNVELLRLFFYQVFTGASVDTAILVLAGRDDPTPASTVSKSCVCARSFHTGRLAAAATARVGASIPRTISAFRGHVVRRSWRRRFEIDQSASVTLRLPTLASRHLTGRNTSTAPRHCIFQVRCGWRSHQPLRTLPR